jgi:REP element-mobilizing transposase RayT
MPYLYQEDYFVVLETNQAEEIITAGELAAKLRSLLEKRQDDLSPELQSFATLDEQVHHLIDTTCELDVGPGEYLQWYVVRLEK